MSTQTIEKDLVKVIFKNKIYRKHTWTIPITKISNKNFMTGQDLSYEKMIGEVALTDEEKKKYPNVIDPHSFPKLPHGKRLDRNSPVVASLLNLAILSGKIAPSLSDYELAPIRYHGYIEDSVADSIVFNKKMDVRYEAETAVRNSSISDYKRIALMVNYRMGKSIQVQSSSEGTIKAELLKACDEQPKEVLQCFPEYNPDISRDIYILELISYKVLSKRPSGEIYDGDIFVGANLSAAKNFMSIGANAPLQDKWKKKLDVKKGLASTSVIEKLATTHSDSRIDKYKKLVDDIKVAIVDENAKGAEYYYTTIEKDYADLLDETTRDLLLEKINTLKAAIHKVATDKKVEVFKEQFEDLDLEQVRKKITIKSSNYKQEDCKDFWDKKEQLIEYMVNVKFNS